MRCLGITLVACCALLVAAASAGGVTKTLVLWPDQLTPTDAYSEDQMVRRPDVLTTITGADFVTLVRVLNLPAGAVVQRIAMMVMGVHATSTTTVQLLRTGYTTEIAPTTVAMVSWEGTTSGFQQKSANADPPVATVLAGYRYYVKAAVRNQYSLLRGIKVTYVVP
jgi:hypothetical protein